MKNEIMNYFTHEEMADMLGEVAVILGIDPPGENSKTFFKLRVVSASNAAHRALTKVNALQDAWHGVMKI